MGSISIDGHFTTNIGQCDHKGTYFYALGSPLSIYVGNGWIDLELSRYDESYERSAMIRISFPGSNTVVPRGIHPLEFHSNYFIGRDRSSWHTGIVNYNEIQLERIYDDIDLRLYFTDGFLKYEFIVSPWGDPSSIVIEFMGHEDLEIVESTGILNIVTSLGIIKDDSPYSYIVRDGRHETVGCRYERVNEDTVQIEVDEYDGERELVIDPAFDFSSFIGGMGTDICRDIFTDGDGNHFLTGYSTSTDFPTTPGSYGTEYIKDGDIFILKINQNGTKVLYSTFLGGTDLEIGTEICVDRSGTAYITGYTFSDDFPSTQGSVFKGEKDAFIIGLNPTGTSLIVSMYVGSKAEDCGNGIQCDGMSMVYCTGFTRGSDFPTTNNALGTSYNGDCDGFVLAYNVSNGSMHYSTYLGGTGSDTGSALVVDTKGCAYVTGNTSSSDFPISGDAYDSDFNRWEDIFVTKLSPDGTVIEYSTYIGGRQDDEYASSIALDEYGRAYVSGHSLSSDFPTTEGAYDTTFNGNPGLSSDAVVFKLEANGSSLLNSTFIGGSENDVSNDILVNGDGQVYLVGRTTSTDFPVNNSSYDPSSNGRTDVFVVQLDSDLGSLMYSTFIGGSGTDVALGVDQDDMSFLLVSGRTNSADFPTRGGLNRSFGGLYDVFVLRIDITPPSILRDITPTTVQVRDPFAFELDASDNAGIRNVTVEFWYPEEDQYAKEQLVMSNGTLLQGTWRFDVVKPPSIPGVVRYIFNITDIHDNSFVTPMRSIRVIDIGLPNVIDISDTIATTGDAFVFRANVSDDVEVGIVSVEYWYDGEIDNKMTETMLGRNVSGNGNGLYTLTSLIIPSDSLDPLHYHIIAIDDGGNENGTREKSVPVRDNDPPGLIDDHTDEFGRTGQHIHFEISVTDNIGIGSVNLKYWFGQDEHLSTKQIMVADTVDLKGVGVYTFDGLMIPSTSIEDMTYFLIINDTSNNSLITDNRFVKILDDDEPYLLVDLSDDIAFTGDEFHFKIVVTDNIGVYSVEVVYGYEASQEIVEPMEWINSTVSGSHTYALSILIPDDILHSLDYSFRISDDINTNVTPLVSIDVLDNDVPTFGPDNSDDKAIWGLDFNFSIEVFDNIDIGSVYVEINLSDIDKERIDLLGANPLQASITIPAHARGEMVYHFVAVDSSGNENETSRTTMTIQNLPPQVRHLPVWTVKEEEDAEFDLTDYIFDFNDPMSTMTISSEYDDLTIKGMVLSLYYEDWRPNHTVPLIITDGHDAVFANLTVSVDNINDPPDVPIIISPKNGEIYIIGEDVVFEGEANDPDIVIDQTLNMTWESSKDGVIATLAYPDFHKISLNDLSEGEHTISLVISDGEFSTRTEISIEIQDTPTFSNYVREQWLLILLMVIVIIVSLFMLSRHLKRTQDN